VGPPEAPKNQPEPVFATLTAVAAGEVDTCRNLEPKSMLEETRHLIDAPWSKKIRAGPDTRPASLQRSYEMKPETPKHKRSEYILSSKVGRIILDELEQDAQTFGEKGDLFKHGHRNKVVYDYTEEGTVRSIEDSLKRLGVDHLDIVWIHDVARDFYGDDWVRVFEEAHRGAMVALTRLREQKVIKAWGLGVNRVESCELAIDMTETHPDAFLLAGRYTLLDHELALQRLMPACEAKKVDIVVGGPYSSGVLAGGTHFEYAPAPPAILAKVQKIKNLCRKFEIPIKTAALHFSLAHPASAAVIPGASKPERIAEDHAAMTTVVPDEFWKELREQKLVSPQAPLPIDHK
jgi:D-threo-aldose 1-dehydrogenase